MSKISFCALGGLGENGKNLYVVNVDDKIFVLDAGLKFPSFDLYGIDVVMPDFAYLKDNADKIMGVFLSHGHDENAGAIAELLKNIQAPVFGSHFTISMVEQILQENNMNVSNYRLFRINDDKVLSFGNVNVSFFYTTHSLPESLGISINTEDGSIVYIPDFTLGFTKDYHYQTSFDKLSSLSKNNVLMLCPESLGVNNIDRVNNDYSFNYSLNETLANSNRVIFSMFSYDLNRIQKVIDVCVQNNRKIALLGRKVQKAINIGMNTGYIKVPQENLVNLKFIDATNDNNDDNLAVIITGIRHEPYFMLQRMMTNQDKLIKITSLDTVVIISPPVVGTEKIATRAIDQLSRTGAKVVNISRSILKSSHADGEDLKMIYQILKPNYICPVIGEYRHQYMHKNIAMDAGYEEDKIIVLENGEMITFEDGILQKSHDRITVADVLVDGSIVGDINEVVLKDREQLSEEGAMVIVTNIDSKRYLLVSGPEVYTKGFVSLCPQDELKEKVSSLTRTIILDVLQIKTIDWNELKNQIRDSVTKEVRNLTKKSPIIIPVIIDIYGEEK